MSEINDKDVNQCNKSIESIFAKKLASAKPSVRSQAIKKLRKWLKLSVGSLSIDDMNRLWKGLHYCFWMSDKPLIQEELSVNISSLIPFLVNKNVNSAWVFIQSYFITETREWFGIDRFRMDKYMMLNRRFLRQIFTLIRDSENRSVSIDKMNGILSDLVFSFKKKKCDRRKVRPCSLGFQMHIIDAYFEELAKSSIVDKTEETIDWSNSDINHFLRPFIDMLKIGDLDDRLHKQIVGRIFHHLITQSNVGQKVEVARSLGVSVDDLSDSDDNEDEEMNEDEQIALDPRAGGVDAAIPQFENIDFQSISSLLFENGNLPETTGIQRRTFFKLSEQFAKTHGGRYPLNTILDEDQVSREKEDNSDDLCIGELSRKSLSEMVKQNEQDRADRLAYEKEMKLKRQEKFSGSSETSMEIDEGVEMSSLEEGENETNEFKDSKGIKEEEKEHSEQIGSSKKRKLSADEVKTEQSVLIQQNSSSILNESMSWEEDESDVDYKDTPTKVRLPTPAVSLPPVSKIEKISPLFKRRRKRTLSSSPKWTVSPVQSSTTENVTTSDDISTLKSPRKSPSPWKVHDLPRSSAPPLKNKSPRGPPKRINFSITSNKYQSLEEHETSVIRSPDIPFLPTKFPSKGVLTCKESPVPLPSSSEIDKHGQKLVKLNTKKNGKSKVGAVLAKKLYFASDFF